MAGYNGVTTTFSNSAFGYSGYLANEISYQQTSALSYTQSSNAISTSSIPLRYEMPQFWTVCTYETNLFVNGTFSVERGECSMVHLLKFVGSVSRFSHPDYNEIITRSVLISDEQLVSTIDLSALINAHKKFLYAEIFCYLKEKFMDVWKSWIEGGNSASSWIVWNVDDSQLTEFEKLGSNYIEERERKENERIEFQSLIKLKKESARQKAQQLLKEVIGEISFFEYKKSGQIEFVTLSGKKYVLHNNDFARNIDVYQKEKNEFKKTHRLCAHLSDKDIPIEDNLVAQILMLQNDEEEFLKIANVC